ncbi:hypothetical protein DF186_22815, partial [Enterococcus hirae]
LLAEMDHWPTFYPVEMRGHEFAKWQKHSKSKKIK